MFQTNILMIENTAILMQSQIKELQQIIIETEYVAANLRSLSGMEGPVNSIKKIAGDIEEERRMMLQMAGGLNQIAACYSNCEENIIDNAEGVRRAGRGKFDWYQIGIYGQLGNMLKQMIY